MGSTAPPGSPKMRSTLSRFKHSSTIRAPASLTALSPLLEEARRGQTLLDVFDGAAVGRRQGRPAWPAIQALKIQRRLEPADPEAPGHAPVRQHHAGGDFLGFLPP